jgi:5-methylcytosine-specific restriction endonuclease McrA
LQRWRLLNWLKRSSGSLDMPPTPDVYRIEPDGSRHLLKRKKRKRRGVVLPSGTVLLPLAGVKVAAPLVPDPPKVPEATRSMNPRYAPELAVVRRSIPALRQQMYEKHPFCWYCGRHMMPSGDTDGVSIEHLIPLSKGGDYEKANLVLAHKSCNRHAGTRLLCEKWKIRQEVRAWFKRLGER